MNTSRTFCRICEPNCPILADVNEEGKVVRLNPDIGHPSGGTACHKGLSFLDVHNDPDRSNFPEKRLNPRTEARGDFARVDWDSALSDVGRRLRDLRDAYGPDCIAAFHGNPIAFDSGSLLSYDSFMDDLGSRMRFAGSTQDMANKTTGAAYIYGSAGSFVLPDLENTDYLLCIGSNPKVSRWTLAAVPNDALDTLKRINERGGKVRFVNPRKTESSTQETGPTYLIKPASDVYFLAALFHEIQALGGIDQTLMERYGKNIDGLRDFVQNYPPEKVAGITGISAAEIREIAADIVAAESAIVYSATGINQSRQGLLSYWLTEMINFGTGNLGRKGGTLKPMGLFGAPEPVAGMQLLKTSLGDLELHEPMGYSTMPAVLMPELIENGDIRALILWSSNPLLTVGGEEKLRKALEKLDLLICVDIYRSATGELADYMLPVTDWIERRDINLVGCSGFQAEPFVQYTDRTEEPIGERRDASWVLARLRQEMGMSSVLDDPAVTDVTAHLLDQTLAYKDLSIEALKAEPWQTIMLPAEAPESVYENCLVHPDKRIDCCPPSFATSGLLDRCHAIFEELEQEPDDLLKLISLRIPYMQNSWMTNVTRFRRGKEAVNPLHMCEQDAVMRGLYDGDRVRVFNENGSLETEIRLNNELRQGAVAMSHGYGHKHTYSMKTAQKKPGANVNVLMPTGVGTFEPISYMSWLCGVPVQVEKILVDRTDCDMADLVRQA